MQLNSSYREATRNKSKSCGLSYLVAARLQTRNKSKFPTDHFENFFELLLGNLIPTVFQRCVE